MTQEIKTPSIFVNSLTAKQGEHVAYFQQFHSGINILYGENAGGKTTIIQLMTYVLGYDINKWIDEALACDAVYAEVELNGSIVTLRRKIENKSRQPLYISYQNLSKSLNQSIDEWLEYPYSVISDKESFSQRLFNILDIPENRVDGNINMTMHQLLRFVYKKQSDAARYILNSEEWDSALKREAIQDYLLGFYDDKLYNAKIELKEYEKLLLKIDAEIKSIITILETSGIDINNSSLTEFIEKIDTENQEIFTKIEKLKKEEVSVYTDEDASIKNLLEKNLKLKNELFEVSEKIHFLVAEIKDNDYFINELKNKVGAIVDSIRLKKVSDNLMEFEMCPSCFTKIESSQSTDCSLCGSENPSESLSVNLLKMKNELEIQLKESLQILTRKKSKLISLKSEKETTEFNLENNVRETNLHMNSIDINKDEKVFNLISKIGTNKEKIESFQKLEKLTHKVQELIRERTDIFSAKSICEDIMASREGIIFKRRESIKNAISQKMILLLKDDIAEQDTFSNVKNVEFDFASNAIIIDSKSVFSESSMFLINNLLHFAIFLTSFEHDCMRIPSILILDGIENGGMSEERSRNFQSIIKKHTENLAYQFQVFITTRSINESLENPNYMLGDMLSKSNKSLKLQ